MTGNDQSNGHERRQFGRRQTCWHAWIVAPNRPRLACVVKDISQGGARLEFEVPAWLPYKFRLVVDMYDLDFPCEIRYRKPHCVGVLFDRIGQELSAHQQASLEDLREWTSGGGMLGTAEPRHQR